MQDHFCEPGQAARCPSEYQTDQEFLPTKIYAFQLHNGINITFVQQVQAEI